MQLDAIQLLSPGEVIILKAEHYLPVPVEFPTLLAIVFVLLVEHQLRNFLPVPVVC